MREAFTAELDAISDDLVHLTRLVGSAMNRATQSLLDADLRLAGPDGRVLYSVSRPRRDETSWCRGHVAR